uniref:Uncharacterized protein n=1 Tax=Anguilla anguilla TaxID=7936 RepID=A0A0E9T4W0_ANGAN
MDAETRRPPTSRPRTAAKRETQPAETAQWRTGATFKQNEYICVMKCIWVAASE